MYILGRTFDKHWFYILHTPTLLNTHILTIIYSMLYIHAYAYILYAIVYYYTIVADYIYFFGEITSFASGQIP